MFTRIAIIGLGLIGSSIARAVHERHLAGTVAAYDANEISLAFARKHTFIDVAAQDMPEAVAGSDLIILATPPATLAAIAELIAPHLGPGAIVMDVCSVKRAAIEAIVPHIPPGVSFVPAHPIAGSEQSGVQAGRGDLFEKKRVIVTPDEPLQTDVLQKITAFWQAMGARVEAMPPALHDMVYAYVSHLPQLLAFTAAGQLEAYKDDANLQKFLRLGESNPLMWTEIFLLNKDNLLKALDRYLDAISHIADELKNAPEDGLSSPSPAGGGRGGGMTGNALPPHAPLLTSPLRGEGMDTLAHTILFPRIAASCLITTVMEAENPAGFSFARYAGTGFADFTGPAAGPPDADIERISGQYAAVAAVLSDYAKRLKTIRAALAGAGDLSKAFVS